MPRLFDTHGHLNSKDFSSSYGEIASAMAEQELWAIMPGFQLPTSKRAIEIADEFPGHLFAAVGYHPIHADDFQESGRDMDEALNEIRQMTTHPKVVAVGEVGLDFFHLPKKDKDEADRLIALQQDMLWKFLEMSQDVRLPLILHCRDAYDDLIDALVRFDNESTGFDTRGVIHSYVGDWEQAKRFLNLDFHFGFNGIITFGNADDELAKVVREVPLEKILIETDAPWLTPEPHRGKRPNTPLLVEHVARRIAEIKEISFEQVAEVTTANALELFKIAVPKERE